MKQVVLAGCIAALVAGCVPKKGPTDAAPAEPEPVAVTTAPVQSLTLRRTVNVVGTLTGFEDVLLAPKAEGRVVAVKADVGDLAVPGGVLLELDPTDARLAVEEARHGLSAELAKLGLADLPDAGFDVAAVPAVRRARVGFDDAARRFKQKKDLFAQAAVSKDDYDAAETEFKLAEAAHNQAVTDARAVLAAARLRRASLDLAEQRLRDCRLTVPVPPGWEAWAAVGGPAACPIRYVVAQRMTSEGEMIRVMPVTNVYRLVIGHVLKLRAAVPERHVAEVRVGLPAEVRVEAYPTAVFPGRVARVNPTVDPLNRAFQVEIEVPNGDGRLKPGGFAKAAVLSRTEAGVRTVPPQAVVSFAGVTKVFVVAGGKATAVPVGVGQRERDWVEIQGEIPADVKVAVSGLSQLVDGSVVRERVAAK